MQGLAEPGSPGWAWGENKRSSLWELVLLLFFLVSFLLVSTWIHTRRGYRHSCQRPSRLAMCLPSRGRARLVGRRRWRLSRRRHSPKGAFFCFTCVSFLGERNHAICQGMAFYCWILLDMLVAKQEPTPCFRDAYFGRYPKVGILGERLAKTL